MAALDVKMLAHPADPSKPFRLLSTTMTIGRGEKSDIRLVDVFISRVHARLERRGSIFHVTDLSSSGTWVNGQKLAFGPDGAIELHDADVRACHAPACLPALVSLTCPRQLHRISSLAVILRCDSPEVARVASSVSWAQS